VFELAFILTTSLLIRVFLNPAIWDSQYHFIGSKWPYFYQPDSWHYYTILKGYLPIWAIHLMPMLALCLSLVSFYFLLRWLGCKDLAFYGTLLFGFFPLVYAETYFGYIDTPPYIMLVMILLAFIIMQLLKK